jgi:hypothetical protein
MILCGVEVGVGVGVLGEECGPVVWGSWGLSWRDIVEGELRVMGMVCAETVSNCGLLA